MFNSAQRYHVRSLLHIKPVSAYIWKTSFVADLSKLFLNWHSSGRTRACWRSLHYDVTHESVRIGENKPSKRHEQGNSFRFSEITINRSSTQSKEIDVNLRQYRAADGRFPQRSSIRGRHTRLH